MNTPKSGYVRTKSELNPDTAVKSVRSLFSIESGRTD